MAFRIMALVALIFALFCSTVDSARLYDRRSDLAEKLPAVDLGCSIPLTGSRPCTDPNEYCEIALSPPAQNKTLRLLALGQGTFNYSCENAQPANAPVYVEQFTQLYDATPLIPSGESDDYLRMLVEELYQFDYTLLRNGTIDCIGTIGTLNSTAVVTLFEIDTFEPYLEESVEAPVNRMYDGAWAHARTLNNEWEMYRVQMVGGVVPPTCQDMNSTFDIRYAAEYWFYHEG